MNIKANYIEHTINFRKEEINVLEIENKKMFFRFVNDLYRLKNGEIVEELIFYDSNYEEINMRSFQIITNYFDLELDSKKLLTDCNKLMLEKLDDNDINELSKIYKKVISKMSDILSKSELPLILENEFNPDIFFKIIKTTIKRENELLSNILNLIDIKRLLRNQQIIIFVNLKEYLSNQEIAELYKYAIYNEVSIILIDSKSYGPCLKYENKLIIDENLDEIVLK